MTKLYMTNIPMELYIEEKRIIRNMSKKDIDLLSEDVKKRHEITIRKRLKELMYN